MNVFGPKIKTEYEYENSSWSTCKPTLLQHTGEIGIRQVPRLTSCGEPDKIGMNLQRIFGKLRYNTWLS